MKKILLILSLFTLVTLAACHKEDEAIGIIGGADGPTAIFVAKDGEKMGYEIITPEKAKEIMESGEEYVLLDVREKDEYDSGHIPGALLLPYGKIEEEANELIPDKSTQILVYCRSGRRSKIAAASLSGLGYTNVKEFGGINDWKYDIE
ncbi:MAG: rhodanese-like domain-containing protein [Ruminococcaceae bacterium]|nr:rhodanese-like domain-containing protein [Oscillospiraceae bacterium]